MLHDSCSWEIKFLYVAHPFVGIMLCVLQDSARLHVAFSKRLNQGNSTEVVPKLLQLAEVAAEGSSRADDDLEVEVDADGWPSIWVKDNGEAEGADKRDGKARGQDMPVYDEDMEWRHGSMLVGNITARVCCFS